MTYTRRLDPCRAGDYTCAFWLSCQVVTVPQSFVRIGWCKVHGCLPFSQKIRMEWSLYEGKPFSEFIDQPDENGAYNLLIRTPSRVFTRYDAKFTRNCLETKRFSQMIREFPEFRSERKKWTTSGGCPQFPKRFSGKLPFLLTSNQNFRFFG